MPECCNSAHKDVAETMWHVTMLMMAIVIDDEKCFRICHMIQVWCFEPIQVHLSKWFRNPAAVSLPFEGNRLSHILQMWSLIWWCTTLMCIFKLPLAVKATPHNLQTKGFKPVWVEMCRFTSPFVINFWFLLGWWRILYSSNWPLSANDLSQI